MDAKDELIFNANQVNAIKQQLDGIAEHLKVEPDPINESGSLGVFFRLGWLRAKVNENLGYLLKCTDLPENKRAEIRGMLE